MGPIKGALTLLSKTEIAKYSVLVFMRSAVQFLDFLALVLIGLMAGGIRDRNRDDSFFSIAGFRLGELTDERLLWLSFITVFLFILKTVLTVFISRSLTSFLAEVESFAAQEVYEFLFVRDLSSFRKHSLGSLQWAVSSSSHIAFSSMLFSWATLVSESFLFLVVLVALGLIDFGSTLLVVAYFVTVLAVFQFLVNGRLDRLGLRIKRSQTGLNEVTISHFNSHFESVVYKKHDHFVDQFRNFRGQFARDQSLQRFVAGLPKAFIEIAMMLGAAIFLAFGLLRGTLLENLPLFGVLLVGGLRMMASMVPVQNALNELRTFGPQAATAQNLVREARSYVPTVCEGVVHRRSGPNNGRGAEVRFSDVSFSYEDTNSPLFQNISMKIPANSFTAIVGPSGSGKTTLVELIVGLRCPSSGVITVDFPLSENSRNFAIGFVPQKPALTEGSLLENIAFGVAPNRIDRNRALRAAKAASLGPMIRDLDEGIDTILSKHLDNLSVGQAQRVGFARALYFRPSLLFLDEVTSAQDPETEASLVESVQELTTKTTVVAIAHRLSTVKAADNVFVLSNGRLEGGASFVEVEKTSKLLREYVEHLRL